jgi:hypothetical protein
MGKKEKKMIKKVPSNMKKEIEKRQLSKTKNGNKKPKHIEIINQIENQLIQDDETLLEI